MPGDLHSGLRTERLGEATGAGVTFSLVRLQRGKTDIAFGVHANPQTHTLSGNAQTGDLLAHLGFVMSPCIFTGAGRCLVREVREGFDLNSFTPAFGIAWTPFKDADGHFRACGLTIDQPVGLALSPFGDGTREPRRASPRPHGDGHAAPETRKLKTSEDDVFRYVLTWITGGADKGWTFHYGPKHPPLSDEIEMALQFLNGFASFPECPEFDFEPCRWRYYPHVADDTGWNTSAEYTHRHFDAHAVRFSSGIRGLLDAHAAMLPFDMSLLPVESHRRDMPSPAPRVAERDTIARSRPARRSGYKYDVALSFAGTERPLAEKLATALRDAGADVFYDEFFPEHLWGKNLPVYFDRVYRKESQFCVIFVSREYSNRAWTYLELRSALARALDERGNEYILPIRIENVDLEGVPPTLGYLDIASYPIERIAEMLLRKLREQR